MADRLATGSEYLNARRRATMGRTVTYRRGAGDVSVVATVGKTVFRIETVDGFMQHSETRDYLIDVAALGNTPPALGDSIIEDVCGVALRFEVIGPGGEPHYRYSDPRRTVYRIHTKFAGPAAVGTGTGV